MKTPTYLFSLILVSAAPIETAWSEDAIGASEVERTDPKIAEALRSPVTMAGPLADAFKAALHTEEVERDLDSAAAQYKAIFDKIRARDGDWIVKHQNGTVEVIPAQEFNTEYTSGEIGTQDSGTDALDAAAKETESPAR